MTVVETEHGRLLGSAGEVRVFRNIPYAAAPVGDLRWRPPAPAVGWTGVRDAQRFGPDCPQPASPLAGATRASGQDEACLTVNIWTPATGGDERLPVMVWFHGGSFMFGTATGPVYDGDVIARRGVVLVTVGSRTGLLGYLAHPALTAESPHGSSGNYGLLDQIAALGWVRRNIEAFGGDPQRVTTFGCSSGGAAISLLATSPLARGTFDQAILQSAGAFRPLASLADAEQAGRRLGDDIDELRRMPVHELIDKTSLLNPAVRGLTTPRVLRPIRDGWVLPDDERTAYETGRFSAVPTIVGSNEDEGSALTATWPMATVGEWRELIAANFGDRSDEALAVYGAERDDDVRGAVSAVFGDTQFTLGARGVARATARRQPKTFRYLFTRRRGGRAEVATHADEVPYVFGTLAAESHAPYDGTDEALSDLMQGAWVRFAATGDPNGPGLPDWPAYREADDGYLEFGDEVTVGRSWRTPSLDFLDSYYAGVARDCRSAAARDAG